MPYDKLKNFGHVLSDSTRVDTLRLVTGSSEPISAAAVAHTFGLHPNAARHHLAKLESLGLVRSVIRRNPAGGRPAKLYTAGSERVDLQYPPRQFLLLVRLLLDAIASSGLDISRSVIDAGRSFGKSLAASSSPPKGHASRDPLAVAGLIIEGCRDLGYDMKITDSSQDTVTVDNANCVFREVASEHSSHVCKLCESLMAGMAESAGFNLILGYNKRLAQGDDLCSARLTFQSSSF